MIYETLNKYLETSINIIFKDTINEKKKPTKKKQQVFYCPCPQYEKAEM